MRKTLRISTSPPNEWDGDSNESSHYCDLREIDDWQNYLILQELPEKDRDVIFRFGQIGYVVSLVYDDCEIGLLIGIEDEQEGLMYVGIDHSGQQSREPAANEALWNPGNAARDLMRGHRLAKSAQASKTNV